MDARNFPTTGVAASLPRRTQVSAGRAVALSARGVVVGTVHTAQLPALHAATSPEAVGGGFYGPSGTGHMGGGPAEQKLYSCLRGREDAQRIWQISEELAGVRSWG